MAHIHIHWLISHLFDWSTTYAQQNIRQQKWKKQNKTKQNKKQQNKPKQNKTKTAYGWIKRAS